MGRKRLDPDDNVLPKRVRKNAYSYVYRPYGTTETITLGKISEMTIAQVWLKYEQVVASRQDMMTFSKLWHMFLSSPAYTELAPRTQKDYLQHQKKLLAVFGKMKADSIKPEHVRKFMDKRGLQNKTQANHERSSMSRVYCWGYERGYVSRNPCSGVRKFSAKPRDTYITDEQYIAIYNHASIPLKVAMEISYLCAARLGDVLSLQWGQVRDEGIYIKQSKTGKRQIKAWSPRLREAIELARTEMPQLGHGIVIYNAVDGKFTTKTLNNHWLAARELASKQLNSVLTCTFHDLKAKGISDYEGSSRDKRIFSGHKTENQVVAYDRKTAITPTLDKPKIGG